jgi:hypothetical protein
MIEAPRYPPGRFRVFGELIPRDRAIGESVALRAGSKSSDPSKSTAARVKTKTQAKAVQKATTGIEPV